MKKSFLYIVLAGIVATLAGCREEYQLGDPFSKIIGLGGTWRLVEVRQVDELARRVGENRDVTSLMLGGTPAEMTFDSEARTFTTNFATSRLYVPASGSWAFDDDLYPSKIIVDSGTTEWILQASVREKIDNYLIFKVYRNAACATLPDGKIAPNSYIYKFVRL